MKVNSVDIRKYNAKQLTVDIQPPPIAINSEWVEGAPTPHEFHTQVKYGSLKLKILFRGSGRNEIIRYISEFLSLMTKKSEIQLDGYKGIYVGELQSENIEKTKVGTKYILNLDFSGYMTDEEVVNEYRGKDEAMFETLGTRDAPCIIEIMPRKDIQEFAISGFGSDDIIIRNLEEGKKVIIDGKNGTVTQEGRNKFADCDMWEFPVLRKKKVNMVEFSSMDCDVKVHYSPMWL